ncbi:hypothetical protein CUMW_132400 [Citrus unshiu]|uniref:cellulase n=1 Tax=Citrus unshiu TaxID=55188 RepID=A0A2H5PFS8_CITUN|nr:hypothetical protein CUMW_132400 [Citrus unshiu]
MSYMVGFGPNFPRRIHHRGSSLLSLSDHPQSIRCDGGFQPFFHSSNPNPNILVGAIVGGPNRNDGFPDDRSDYSHSEPVSTLLWLDPRHILLGANPVDDILSCCCCLL